MKRISVFLAVLLVFCVLFVGCSPKENNAQENVIQENENNDVSTGNLDITIDLSENTPAESDEPFEAVTEEETYGEETAEEVIPEVVPAEPEEETHEVMPEQIAPVHVGVESIKLSIYDVTVSVGQRTMPIVTMSPYNASDKGEIWTSSDEAVATVDGIGNITGKSEGACKVTVTSRDNPEVFATVNVAVIKGAECTYIDGILIANKTYPLPESYAPGWDAEASAQINVMRAAAAQDGINLFVKSGYRSYIDQKIIYNGYVARDGKEAADTYSARPGHSEHQTGLAFDMNSTANSFAGTPEAEWLSANCHKYGFIIRYPKGKEHITGYIYEPWHVRYIGVEKAKEVFESGLCLEEFLGITSVYSY